MKRFALTVLAPDRPGIVRELSSAVADAGGNWLESRMATLAGRFAGILLVEAPAESADAVADAVRGLPGISVSLQEADVHSGPASSDVRLTVLGTDRPGIVQRITAVLAAAGINVESLDTERRAAPHAGGRIFEARATLAIPSSVSVDDVQSELEAIAYDLMVAWEGADGTWSAGAAPSG